MNTTWMPREKWDAMVRGEDCPLCREVLKTEASNEFGYTVAEISCPTKYTAESSTISLYRSIKYGFGCL